MLSRDPYLYSSQFVSPDGAPRVKAASVVSIESDHTITVTVNGSTEQVANVNYLGSVAPRPGSLVWVLTDGVDLFAFGVMAGSDRTIAPRTSRSTSQNITNANDTAIDFDGVNSDAWGCWSSSNPARLTAPITGRYMAVGSVTFEANATGFRRVWVEKDGSSTLARSESSTALAGSALWLNVATPAFTMTKGEYIRLMVRQNSGGTLAVLNSSTFSPTLSLIYVGP